ncbi:MAG: class I fructose-bisphosphate aldolase [Gemmatimonadaceae bacterium]
MVLPGASSTQQASIREVADATVRCLRRAVPAAVPGVVFLSGGQEALAATAHLNAMNAMPVTHPWPLSFSFARALQSPAMEAWRGQPRDVPAGQRAFSHRARCNAAARLGLYTPDHESVGA